MRKILFMLALLAIVASCGKEQQPMPGSPQYPYAFYIGNVTSERVTVQVNDIEFEIGPGRSRWIEAEYTYEDEGDVTSAPKWVWIWLGFSRMPSADSVVITAEGGRRATHKRNGQEFMPATHNIMDSASYVAYYHRSWGYAGYLGYVWEYIITDRDLAGEQATPARPGATQQASH